MSDHFNSVSSERLGTKRQADRRIVASRVHASYWPFIILFGMAALIFALTGYITYRYEAHTIKREKSDELRIVTDYKIHQIAHWQHERIADALSITKEPYFKSAVNRLVFMPHDIALKNEVRDYLETHQRFLKYHNFVLANIKGDILLSLEPRDDEISANTRQQIAKTVSTKKIVFSSFFRCPMCKHLHLDIYAPIVDMKNQIVAVLVLRTDPKRFFHHYVQTFPLACKTGECLLLRRDRNNLLYVSPPTLKSAPPLTARMPPSKSEMLVARGTNASDTFLTMDYRGVKVLACVRPVPGTPWLMETKVDANETFAALERHGWFLFSITLLLILMSGAGAGFMYQSSAKRILKVLFLSEQMRANQREESHITLHSIGDAVISTDAAGRIWQMNCAAEDLTGWIESDAKGKPISEVFCIINEETHAKAADPVERVLREGTVVGLANHSLLISKNGMERPIADSAAPIRDESGNITGVVLVFRDQTKERETEKLILTRLKLLEYSASHSLEELIHKTLEEACALTNSPIGFYHFIEEDPKNQPANASSPQTIREFYKTEGNGSHYPVDTAGVWKDCINEKGPVIHNDYASLLNEQGISEGHANVIRELVVPVERGDQVVAILGVANNPTGYTAKDSERLAYLADVAWCIVEQKLTITKLRESELRFRTIYENFPIGIAQVGLDFHIQDANPAYCRFLGYPAEELVGKYLPDINHPETREANLKQKFRMSRGEIDNYEMEKRFICKDGREVLGLTKVSLIRDPLGSPAYIIGAVMDISERKRGEAERMRLLMAIEQTNEIVVITDAAGTMQYVNPAFNKITGYSEKEAIGQNPRILKSGHHDQAFYKNLWETIITGTPWKGRLINKRKDGSQFTVECSISPMRDKDKNVVNFVWIARDITYELELQKRISHAQKMEAIGALAGGIAHDFNNLLFPITGLAEMLLLEFPPESLMYRNVREILKAAKRAGNLVQHILSFSRQSEQGKTPVRLQLILKEVLELMRATIPSNIEIAYNLQSDCGLVMADPTQIHQIAMNLMTNAFHAVEQNGGKISIKLSEQELTAGDDRRLLLEPGKYALISVSDTGHGIPSAIMGKIFEPYFTTKPQGKGTGLGLSVIYGIVREYLGDIQVTSDVGKGTTFDVYLPLKEEDNETMEPDAGFTEATGTERILLVDDEEQIVLIEKLMLESLGYRIEERTSSIEALKAFRANPDRYDIVISDMTMPNMTGVQLAKELLAIRPSIPVIICTGFSDWINQEKAQVIGIKGLLKKPAGRLEMAQLVRKVLDEAKRSHKAD